MTEDAGVVQADAPDYSAVIGKEAIYKALTDKIAGQTGKRVSQAFAKDVFNFVVEKSIDTAIQEGTIRFNGGYGSFKLRDLKGGTRQLPDGTTTSFGPRQKIRYESGVSVEAKMGTPGASSDAPKDPPSAPAVDSGDVMEGIDD